MIWRPCKNNSCFLSLAFPWVCTRGYPVGHADIRNSNAYYFMFIWLQNVKKNLSFCFYLSQYLLFMPLSKELTCRRTLHSWGIPGSGQRTEGPKFGVASHSCLWVRPGNCWRLGNVSVCVCGGGGQTTQYPPRTSGESPWFPLRVLECLPFRFRSPPQIEEAMPESFLNIIRPKSV